MTSSCLRIFVFMYTKYQFPELTLDGPHTCQYYLLFDIPPWSYFWSPNLVIYYPTVMFTDSSLHCSRTVIMRKLFITFLLSLLTLLTTGPEVPSILTFYITFPFFVFCSSDYPLVENYFLFFLVYKWVLKFPFLTTYYRYGSILYFKLSLSFR